MSDDPRTQDPAELPRELAAAREHFFDLVGHLRPELHRYCSRLVGSVIDGEDVVQETMAKALYAASLATELPPLRPWLFRIAHNTAVDFLRRYDRRLVEPMAQVPEEATREIGPDPETVRAALSSFVTLPLLQRSAVILKDVLGLPLEEIAATTGTTVPAVKAALSRGRGRLREQARPEPEIVPWRDRPETSAADRARLGRYAGLFNARDWEGLRELIVDETRLDLVSKSARRGDAVKKYFERYSMEPGWRMALGSAEGRAALGLYRGESDELLDIVLIDFRGEDISLIRDYRYVPYVARAIEFIPTARPS